MCAQPRMSQSQVSSRTFPSKHRANNLILIDERFSDVAKPHLWYSKLNRVGIRTKHLDILQDFFDLSRTCSKRVEMKTFFFFAVPVLGFEWEFTWLLSSLVSLLAWDSFCEISSIIQCWKCFQVSTSDIWAVHATQRQKNLLIFAVRPTNEIEIVDQLMTSEPCYFGLVNVNNWLLASRKMKTLRPICYDAIPTVIIIFCYFNQVVPEALNTVYFSS